MKKMTMEGSHGILPMYIHAAIAISLKLSHVAVLFGVGGWEINV